MKQPAQIRGNRWRVPLFPEQSNEDQRGFAIESCLISPVRLSEAIPGWVLQEAI